MHPAQHSRVKGCTSSAAFEQAGVVSEQGNREQKMSSEPYKSMASASGSEDPSNHEVFLAQHCQQSILADFPPPVTAP